MTLIGQVLDHPGISAGQLGRVSLPSGEVVPAYCPYGKIAYAPHGKCVVDFNEDGDYVIVLAGRDAELAAEQGS